MGVQFGGIYLFLAALGLCCFSRTLSGCSESGLVSVVVPSFSLQWFSCCRAQALGAQASVVAAPGSVAAKQAHLLWGTGARTQAQAVLAAPKLGCSEACGIFPDPGIEHVSPASAGGFLSTVLPGESSSSVFIDPSSNLIPFVKDLHTVFVSGYTNLYSHEQRTRVPFSLHSRQDLFVC